jgi:hypothetical protein
MYGRLPVTEWAKLSQDLGNITKIISESKTQRSQNICIKKGYIVAP